MLLCDATDFEDALTQESKAKAKSYDAEARKVVARARTQRDCNRGPIHLVCTLGGEGG